MPAGWRTMGGMNPDEEIGRKTAIIK